MTCSVTRPYWLQGQQRIFACYHGPSGRTRDIGALLCASFGHEMMSAHRAYRHLAEQLAASGVPSLRFDYGASGDSSGGDGDPDQAGHWLGSIDQAVRMLESKGVTRIALIGIRLGALLAIAQASTRPIDSLVLIAPPVSASAYLREMRALHSMRMGHLRNTGTGTIDDGDDVFGFLLRSNAIAKLQKVTEAPIANPAMRVLVVARDDLAGQESMLIERLTSLGARVTFSRTGGYSAVIEGDPVCAVVPDRLWREVVGWLTTDCRSDGPHVCFDLEPRRTEVHAHDSDPLVAEEIVDVDGMFGILTTPIDVPPHAPVILLNNIGANHHVGCNRLYVNLARQWAALGFRVLRFDLVGIGDTPATPGRAENEVYSPFAITDVCRAMNWLAETRRCDRFVLAGICSGAYVSYYAAIADARVESVMLMNPLKLSQRQSDWFGVLRRFQSTVFYRRAAVRLGGYSLSSCGRLNVDAPRLKAVAHHWTRLGRSIAGWRRSRQVELGFRSLCARGARVLLVCGENDASLDVVKAHLGQDACRMRHEAGFRLEVVSNTDHTFAPRSARLDLSKRLTRYLLGGRRPNAVCDLA